MRILRISSLLLTILKCRSGLAQATSKRTTLVINGKAGETTVVEINDRTYTLTHIANESLTFQDNRMMLALPAVDAGTSPANPGANHPTGQVGLPRDFSVTA